MLKRFLKRWPLVGLMVIAIGLAGGCVTDEIANNTDFILEEFTKSSAPAGSIEAEDGTILVYAADLPGLVSKVGSFSEESDKRNAIKKYLLLQERIDCVLDDIEEAVTEETTLRCQGRVLVDDKSEHGLLDVTQMSEKLNSYEGNASKREYLTEYLVYWDETQQVNHVTESLGQMKRTKAIPLFGPLVRAIHNFPIMYEGDELVPKKDVSTLLNQYGDHDDEDARRSLVAAYLESQR